MTRINEKMHFLIRSNKWNDEDSIYLILNPYTTTKNEELSLLPIITETINHLVDKTGRDQLIVYTIKEFDETKISVIMEKVKTNAKSILMLTCFSNNMETVFEYIKSTYSIQQSL